MISTKKSGKRAPSRFVPRIALGIAVVCVVPACVAGCQPMTSVAADGFGGVADVTFRPEVFVADTGFGRETGHPDITVADISFTVATDAFSVADTGFRDAPVDATGVADVGFGPG